MNYQPILEDIHAEVRPLIGRGRVAGYIPPLAGRSSRHFGMCLRAMLLKTSNNLDNYVATVWSRTLSDRDNYLAGTRALELLITKT